MPTLWKLCKPDLLYGNSLSRAPIQSPIDAAKCALAEAIAQLLEEVSHDFQQSFYSIFDANTFASIRVRCTEAALARTKA